jgi:hypothetical protein
VREQHRSGDGRVLPVLGRIRRDEFVGKPPGSRRLLQSHGQCLYQFAAAVDKAKHDLEEKATEIAAAIGGGVLLTIFTAGFSDAAASAAVAAIVPDAVASFALLGTTVADVAGTVLAGAAMGLLETTMAQVTTAITQLGFGDKPSMPTTLDEVNALVVGGLAGPLSAGMVGSAKAGTAAAAAGLSDDISVVAPELLSLMNSLPDAVDTPAGKALVDLVGRQRLRAWSASPRTRTPRCPPPRRPLVQCWTRRSRVRWTLVATDDEWRSSTTLVRSADAGRPARPEDQ